MSSDKVFSKFPKSIWKKSLVVCYVDEKWLTNLDLQDFHLKKTSNFQKLCENSLIFKTNKNEYKDKK